MSKLRGIRLIFPADGCTQTLLKAINYRLEPWRESLPLPFHVSIAEAPETSVRIVSSTGRIREQRITCSNVLKSLDSKVPCTLPSENLYLPFPSAWKPPPRNILTTHSFLISWVRRHIYVYQNTIVGIFHIKNLGAVEYLWQVCLRKLCIAAQILKITRGVHLTLYSLLRL